MSKITCTHCQSDWVILPWPSVNQDEWSCMSCNCEFRPTQRAVDLGDSSPLQVLSTPEVYPVAQADITPAPTH